jgi:hypothetical protein
MALEEHSFRHLLPTFIISPGTQVVLKVDKPLPDGSVRQRGSVAVVQESPADNQNAYVLRFAAGQTVNAYFRELAIRRKEVEDELALTGEDLRPWIVYRCRPPGTAASSSKGTAEAVYDAVTASLRLAGEKAVEDLWKEIAFVVHWLKK